MTIAQEITDYAGRLFDVVGSSQLPSGDNLLILGLESKPGRDLDDMGYLDGKFQLYGFEKHVAPRLGLTVDFIRGQGFSAEPTGRYGYPLFGEISLKKAAIQAGLGRRLKSTVVLHPKYGHRLRFMAVRTDAPLEPPADSTFAEEENPLCDGCSICIDACPTKALEPYRMPDISLCLSNITLQTEDGRSILCDICLHLCPAARE
jgi:ferredoxin